MNKQNTLYKVVTSDLRSVITSGQLTEQEFVLQYSQSEFVSGPMNSRIFCFDSLSHARNFRDIECSSYDPFRIFTVETKGNHIRPKHIGPVGSLREYYHIKKLKHKLDYTWETPEGTVLVSAVRLLKEIT